MSTKLACGTQHRGFPRKTDHLIGTSAHAPQRPIVTYWDGHIPYTQSPNVASELTKKKLPSKSDPTHYVSPARGIHTLWAHRPSVTQPIAPVLRTSSATSTQIMNASFSQHCIRTSVRALSVVARAPSPDKAKVSCAGHLWTMSLERELGNWNWGETESRRGQVITKILKRIQLPVWKS
ncbi:hypothetical protein TNCV_103731 [Trichonephila clavipes]|nr:hypothetical protein TNCV_103731 [Trichonephila clavipes]